MCPSVYAFVILALIPLIAVTATTTTLSVVQSQKGCLYYPSVCTLRDEIKKKLQPEVIQLERKFRETYGDPKDINPLVKRIQKQVTDIAQNLTHIEVLQVTLRSLILNLTDALPDHMDYSGIYRSIMKKYNNWKVLTDQNAASNLQNMQSVVIDSVLHVGIGLASSLSSLEVGALEVAGEVFASAAAEVVSVVGIAFSVVDVVSSVTREKEVRDDLKAAKETLIDARNKINKTTKKMVAFQKQFCNSIVTYLRELSSKGKAYNKVFNDLNGVITSIYGNHSSCDNETVYSKTTLPILRRLEQDIPLVLNLLGNQTRELMERIKEVKNIKKVYDGYLSALCIEKKNPKEVFASARNQMHEFSQKLSPTYFSFLQLVAFNLLPNKTCYWGINLLDIRLNLTQSDNFVNYPICKSPEIANLASKIENAVANHTIPCAIFEQVRGSVFLTKTSVLHYIADVCLPTAICYWGYNLADLRAQKKTSLPKYEREKMNSGMFTTLGFFPVDRRSSMITTARSILCTTYKVCDVNWQNFIICATWKNTKIPTSISCPQNSRVVKDLCIPRLNRYQKC